MKTSALSDAERQQMSRHLMMPEIAEDGQMKLKAASVLIVGTGGLGSPAALYLAAAGVGRIGLVDHDLVEASNLQRQVLFATKDIGRPKAECAAERLRELNPYIEVEALHQEFNYENAIQLVSNYDLILDGTDNFSTRYLINDACVVTQKINVHASVFKFEGQVCSFNSANGPCYRCVFPSPPPTGMMPACGEIGVLGVVPGLVGCLQATEAIKAILELGTPLSQQMLYIDTLTMNFRRLSIARDPNCTICSQKSSVLLDKKSYLENLHCEGSEDKVNSISAEEFDILMKQKGVSVIDVRELYEREQDRIPGSLHIPLSAITSAGKGAALGETVVIYCARGLRGEQAAVQLRSIFPNKRIFNLKGGILSYRQKSGDRPHAADWRNA